jgi:hypothetical protein
MNDTGYRFAIGTLLAISLIVVVVLVDAIGRNLGAGLAGGLFR